MANLTNVLKRINSKIDSSINSYVYYDELTGNIKKISNTRDQSDDSLLIVSHDQVKNIIKGRYKQSEYLVTYDNSQKTNILRRRDFVNNTHNIKDRIYKIKQVYDNNSTADLVIERDIRQQTWYFTTLMELKENVSFRNSESLKSTSLSIFATETNDPNILYRNFNISVNTLLDHSKVSVPFIYDWENTGKTVSMYTNKFFDTYAYRIILDE